MGLACRVLLQREWRASKNWRALGHHAEKRIPCHYRLQHVARIDQQLGIHAAGSFRSVSPMQDEAIEHSPERNSRGGDALGLGDLPVI